MNKKHGATTSLIAIKKHVKYKNLHVHQININYLLFFRFAPFLSKAGFLLGPTSNGAHKKLRN